jgi:hypothetical protein
MIVHDDSIHLDDRLRLFQEDIALHLSGEYGDIFRAFWMQPLPEAEELAVGETVITFGGQFISNLD